MHRPLRSVAALMAAAAASLVTAQPQPADVRISDTVAAGTVPPHFVSFGWEAQVMLNEYLLPGHLGDPVFIKAAANLAPAVVRVGGISADWLRYVPDGDESSPGSTSSGGGRLQYWPTAPQNITYGNIDTLIGFHNASGLSLLLDLNELYGRNCQTVNNATGQGDWCVGEWDTSNVRALLQHLHDEGVVGGASSLFGFELGNELYTHLAATDNTADIIELAAIIADVWAGSTPPPLFAPSTDNCYTPDTAAIMKNVTGVVRGFTFHAYPGGSGADLVTLLTNSTWLRTGIMTASDAMGCIDAWNATGGPRSAMELWVTESSSSWNWTLPSPAQNSFLNGFFTLPELGQYATTGVGVVARWSFAEPSPFGTIIYNATRGGWDVAADYWLMLLHKRVVGATAIATQVYGDSPALVYAHCPTGTNNGSMTIFAVNPSTTNATLNLWDDSGATIATAPRTEYVFTAPGGPDDLASYTPSLNGGPPLRLALDGSIPALDGNFVASNGGGSINTLTLPPRSQAYYVLMAAAAPICAPSAI